MMRMSGWRVWMLVALVLVAVVVVGRGTPAAAAGSREVIIVFKDGADPQATAAALTAAYDLRPGFVYQHALRGMSATVSAGRSVGLARDGRVAGVYDNIPVTIAGGHVPVGVSRIFAPDNATIGIDGRDDTRVDVDIAILDTGVDLEHPDLNVVAAIDCTLLVNYNACVAGGDDLHGHGTHVAGTAAAIDGRFGVVGVAPGARIHAVQVLGESGNGSMAGVIAGIDYVTLHSDTIEVANMSLIAFGYYPPMEDAIRAAVARGVAFAVAAGNDAADAANYVPASYTSVLTVSALADSDGLPGGLGPMTPCGIASPDDTLAWFSNWGTVVDVAAPGDCVMSTYPLEYGGFSVLSGTSMATPHVAGALALLASRDNPQDAIDVISLYTTIRMTGNRDWTDRSGDGVQEPLLDVGAAADFDPLLMTSEPKPSVFFAAAGGQFKQPGRPVVKYDKRDVVHWDGAVWSRYFDGSAMYLPAAADINAFDIDGVDLYIALSKATAIDWFGKPEPHDIIRYDVLQGWWYVYFDGSDVGLTQMTERIDGLQMAEASDFAAAPECLAHLLISTAGGALLPGIRGVVKGEDVVHFCATSLGEETAGTWHRYLDGAAERMPAKATSGLSLAPGGDVLYVLSTSAFRVDEAKGRGSSIYAFDRASGRFSGPVWAARGLGLRQTVDSIDVEGPLP